MNMENELKKVFYITVTDNRDSKNRAYANFVFNLCKQTLMDNGLEALIDVDSFNPQFRLKEGNIKYSLFNNLVKYDCYVVLLDDYENNYNPNVWFELGVVSTMNTPIVLIASQDTKIPFDVNDINVVRINNCLLTYCKTLCEQNKNNLHDINWNTKIREIHNINDINLENAFSDFSLNLKDAFMTTLTNGNPFNPLFDSAKIAKLGFNGLYQMLVETRMINLLEGKAVTAQYISGEKEAFEELADEVKKARHSLRTTRFADQSIVATETKQYYNDFMEALYKASHNVEKCYRIICNNNYLKWHDVFNALLNCDNKTQIFIRKQDYSINFELVIIDEIVAFIHFYQTSKSGDTDVYTSDRRHDSNVQQIKSTLKITGSYVCRELSRVFDRLHHRDFDTDNENPSDLSRTLLGVNTQGELSEQEKERGYFMLGNEQFTNDRIGTLRKEERIKKMIADALEKWEMSKDDRDTMRKGLASIRGEDLD